MYYFLFGIFVIALYRSLNRIDFSDKYKEVVYRYENTNPKMVLFYKNSLLHCDHDTPSMIIYKKDGTVKSMTFFKKGKMHRESNLPAYIAEDDYGTQTTEYWENGKKLKINHKTLGYTKSLYYFCKRIRQYSL